MNIKNFVYIVIPLENDNGGHPAPAGRALPNLRPTIMEGTRPLRGLPYPTF